MDYRKVNEKIQADFAYRVGKLAEQYFALKNTSNPIHSYETTLCICLLQSLLTSCSELIKSMKDKEREKGFFSEPITDIPSFGGIRPEMIKRNSFYGEILSRESVITHIRNALSHPNFIDISAEFPSTGFDVIISEGEIKKVCFIDSPDAKDNRLKQFNTKEHGNRHIKEKNFSKELKLKCEIKEINSMSNHYGIFYNNKPFGRVFHVEIEVKILYEFLQFLSAYLSKALLDNWEEIINNNDVGKIMSMPVGSISNY